MKCSNCGENISYHESWTDVDGESRHLEYLICPKCKTVHSLDGSSVDVPIEPDGALEKWIESII